MLNKYKGHCCPPHLISSELSLPNLTCGICYQIMASPVKLDCEYKHSFGLSCISSWAAQKANPTCPFCRKVFKDWEVDKCLKDEVFKLNTHCPYCQEWAGSLAQADNHYQQCSKYTDYLSKELFKVVEDMIEILEIGINPHLKENHSLIYEQYVQNWVWLKHDTRNWKWWWWADNPWWEEPCAPCNDLWHKNEREIDKLEHERIRLIGMLEARQQTVNSQQ